MSQIPAPRTANPGSAQWPSCLEPSAPVNASSGPPKHAPPPSPLLSSSSTSVCVNLLPEHQPPLPNTLPWERARPKLLTSQSPKTKTGRAANERASGDALHTTTRAVFTVLFLKGLAERQAWWAPSSRNYLISDFFLSFPPPLSSSR